MAQAKLSVRGFCAVCRDHLVVSTPPTPIEVFMIESQLCKTCLKKALVICLGDDGGDGDG